MGQDAKTYPEAIERLLSSIRADNAQTVTTVARVLKDSVDGGGLVFVFGSGHSAILVEEAFHRAGGLIPVIVALGVVVWLVVAWVRRRRRRRAAAAATAVRETKG